MIRSLSWCAYLNPSSTVDQDYKVSTLFGQRHIRLRKPAPITYLRWVTTSLTSRAIQSNGNYHTSLVSVPPRKSSLPITHIRYLSHPRGMSHSAGKCDKKVHIPSPGRRNAAGTMNKFFWRLHLPISDLDTCQQRTYAHRSSYTWSNGIMNVYSNLFKVLVYMQYGIAQS